MQDRVDRRRVNEDKEQFLIICKLGQVRVPVAPAHRTVCNYYDGTGLPIRGIDHLGMHGRRNQGLSVVRSGSVYRLGMRQVDPPRAEREEREQARAHSHRPNAVGWSFVRSKSRAAHKPPRKVVG
eukprot:scaffold272299_cov37-Tisochrysis_lutea.AAC.1